MALQNSPNDPLGSDYANRPLEPSRMDSDYIESDARSGMTGGRIAAMIVAVALAIGAIYFGMNASSTDPAKPAVATTQTAPAAGSTAQNASPPVAPGVRDVTPNRAPGTTTGSAPSVAPSTTAPSSSGSTSAPSAQ